ncbi:glycohydrolase toxin TNT-related protein [Actinokineospora iranica]|uniref:TNT domain-containing protein n=1 Tax=Actinokineospora iranica TaxID=1271860 RepID=A0A1G6SJB1_9PSEU|nr:glycohydrolase toxin TNT-related protein [Actinokineospora iranica]SDD17020.1 Protein of unknown function [Actinokineospora iranica]
MAQPTQLNPTEQDALVKQIGLALLRAAPAEWASVSVEYRALGRYRETAGRVTFRDETVADFPVSPDIAMLFSRLRAGMYREGRGTWYNARYQLDHPSAYNLEYDRDEPRWITPPPPPAYADDLRTFPRDEENVPDWLIRRLASLKPPFRMARIFDGQAPGGRPAINRPPLDETERDDLQHYLDSAPVVLPGRGFDTDHLDEEGRLAVPVAFHTDGAWIWPAAVNYYLRVHGVPPEPDLVDHIRRTDFTVPEVDDNSRAAAAAFVSRGPARPPRPGGVPAAGGLGGPPRAAAESPAAPPRTPDPAEPAPTPPRGNDYTQPPQPETPREFTPAEPAPTPPTGNNYTQPPQPETPREFTPAESTPTPPTGNDYTQPPQPETPREFTGDRWSPSGGAETGKPGPFGTSFDAFAPAEVNLGHEPARREPSAFDTPPPWSRTPAAESAESAWAFTETPAQDPAQESRQTGRRRAPEPTPPGDQWVPSWASAARPTEAPATAAEVPQPAAAAETDLFQPQADQDNQPTWSPADPPESADEQAAPEPHFADLIDAPRFDQSANTPQPDATEPRRPDESPADQPESAETGRTTPHRNDHAEPQETDHPDPGPAYGQPSPSGEQAFAADHPAEPAEDPHLAGQQNLTNQPEPTYAYSPQPNEPAYADHFPDHPAEPAADPRSTGQQNLTNQPEPTYAYSPQPNEPAYADHTPDHPAEPAADPRLVRQQDLTDQAEPAFAYSPGTGEPQPETPRPDFADEDADRRRQATEPTFGDQPEAAPDTHFATAQADRFAPQPPQADLAAGAPQSTDPQQHFADPADHAYERGPEAADDARHAEQAYGSHVADQSPFAGGSHTAQAGSAFAARSRAVVDAQSTEESDSQFADQAAAGFTQPSPADESQAVPQSHPADEPRFTPQSHADGEPQFADQPHPSDEPGLTTQPHPTDEPRFANQPHPTHEPQQTDQPYLTDEPRFADQPHSEDESRSATQPHSTDEPQFADRPLTGDPRFTPHPQAGESQFAPHTEAGLTNPGGSHAADQADARFTTDDQFAAQAEAPQSGTRHAEQPHPTGAQFTDSTATRFTEHDTADLESTEQPRSRFTDQPHSADEQFTADPLFAGDRQPQDQSLPEFADQPHSATGTGEQSHHASAADYVDPESGEESRSQQGDHAHFADQADSAEESRFGQADLVDAQESAGQVDAQATDESGQAHAAVDTRYADPADEPQPADHADAPVASHPAADQVADQGTQSTDGQRFADTGFGDEAQESPRTQDRHVDNQVGIPDADASSDPGFTDQTGQAQPASEPHGTQAADEAGLTETAGVSPEQRPTDEARLTEGAAADEAQSNDQAELAHQQHVAEQAEASARPGWRQGESERDTVPVRRNGSEVPTAAGVPMGDAKAQDSRSTKDNHVSEKDSRANRQPAGSWSAEVPPAALPEQGSPAATVERARTRLTELGIGESRYRIGTPGAAAWTMEQTGEGWRVGWFDQGFVAPTVFADVADAAAFLVGKVLLDSGARGAPVDPGPATVQASPADLEDDDDDEYDYRARRQVRPTPGEDLFQPSRPEKEDLFTPAEAKPFAFGGRGAAPEPAPAAAAPAAVFDDEDDDEDDFVPRRPEPRPTPRAEARGPEPSLTPRRPQDWPIQPRPGEPPLTLFRGKRLLELAPGTEIDRYGEPGGNLTYAAGTPFERRSLVPDWVNRPYRAYRVVKPTEALTGVAIPWFEQPGGGTAYLLARSIVELLDAGVLVEVNDREAPTRP